MLNLRARVIPIQRAASAQQRLWSVTKNQILPRALRSNRAFLVRDAVPDGFGCYLFSPTATGRSGLPSGVPALQLPAELNYLADEDVISIRGDGKNVRVVWRAASPHNSVLLTERCNNYCLMCSQPPKDTDDGWLLDEAMRLVPLIPRSAREIGFTGGEPTLYGPGLIQLIKLTKSYLPDTAVHVLSNGRSFADRAFAENWARIEHPDLMVGIPVYSDDPARHDYVVQARGAFDETVRGILNLKRLGQKVEIRVVIHRQTVDRLPQLTEWIGRNLLFVDHVALMGMEMMGFARANVDVLWTDPYGYRDILSEAVATLRSYGITTSVFNHQLCVVNDDISPVYRKSISDWKNEYLKVCDSCTRRTQCGGFFSSSALYRHSDYIRPFLE